MGLFDSLKNIVNSDAVKKAVSEGGDVLEKLGQTVSKELGVQGNSANETAASQPVVRESAPEQNYPQAKPSATVEDQFPKFDAIISRNFADCEVRRNVPASELQPGCHPACTPVQFMFYRDSKPVLAVVLVRTNNYRGMNVVATKKICEELGIKYIRFYHEYENAEDYVVGRIKNNL